MMRMPKAEVSSVLYSAHRHHQRFAQSSGCGETWSKKVLKISVKALRNLLLVT